MQVARYFHSRSENFPVEAEIIQGDDGKWFAYLEGELIGTYGGSFEALKELRKVDARLHNDLWGSHWRSDPIQHRESDGI